MTEVERLVTAEKMAMRNDVEWFRTTFLEPDAPATLSKDDDPWPYVRGFSEYDGLATVVAAMATHPQLFTKFFDPYNAPGSHTLVLGLNGSVHGIRDGKRVSDLLHYLMATAMGPGSGEWFGRMCDHEKPGVHHEGVATDMTMIGDFGRDQDDEKALAMAVAMRRIGLVGNPSDGFFGKTISLSIANFWAEVSVWPSACCQANTGMSVPSFHSSNASILPISVARYTATSWEACCTRR